ncbi:2-aminoadipate transaminase-like [Prorops nasuta]|uniref:2-aminoadipate transaminase-like n=1 Tax=Prorops nasuta TaxID=863751 RepID=UPI0034CD1E8A
MEVVKDPFLRHLFNSDPIFNVYNSNVTNMSVGAPGPDLLKYCVDMMRASTLHRMEEEEKEGKYFLFQYGITPGLWECREELAKFLSKRYGDPVKRENLVLSCGATHGLQIFLTSLVAPNGIIFVEEATYMIALDVFKQFPLMKIITIPMKDDLVNLDAFDKILSKTAEETMKDIFLNDQKIFWGMFYTIPVYHNPTGMTLPPASCKLLVELSRKYKIAVFCDDVYNLLHYCEGYPPHRLLYYDNSEDPNYIGSVVSNGSFSKILSPAIRLGWIESSSRVINILKASGTLCSGGAVNHYVSGIITSLLHLEMEDKYLDTLISVYKERLNALCDSLNRYLPDCCSYRKPNGGYFVWIHLPEGIDGTAFISWCQEVYKVSAIPGNRFSHKGQLSNRLRLSYSFHSKETLQKASKILCTALLEFIKNKEKKK